MLTSPLKIEQTFFMCFVVFRAIARMAKQLQVVGPVGTAATYWNDVIHTVAVANVSLAVGASTMLGFQQSQKVITGKATDGVTFPVMVIPDIGIDAFGMSFPKLSIIFRYLFRIVITPLVIAIQFCARIIGILRPMFSKNGLAVIFIISAMYFGATLLVRLSPLTTIFADSLLIGGITLTLTFGLAFPIIGVIEPPFRTLTFFATSAMTVFSVFIAVKFSKWFGNAASSTGFNSGHLSFPFMTVRNEVKRGKMVTENHRFGDQPSPRKLYHKILWKERGTSA